MLLADVHLEKQKVPGGQFYNQNPTIWREIMHLAFNFLKALCFYTWIPKLSRWLLDKLKPPGKKLLFGLHFLPTLVNAQFAKYACIYGKKTN